MVACFVLQRNAFRRNRFNGGAQHLKYRIKILLQLLHFADERLFRLSDARKRSLEVPQEFVLRFDGEKILTRACLLEILLGDFAVSVAVFVKDFGSRALLIDHQLEEDLELLIL